MTHEHIQRFCDRLIDFESFDNLKYDVLQSYAEYDIFLSESLMNDFWRDPKDVHKAMKEYGYDEFVTFIANKEIGKTIELRARTLIDQYIKQKYKEYNSKSWWHKLWNRFDPPTHTVKIKITEDNIDEMFASLPLTREVVKCIIEKGYTTIVKSHAGQTFISIQLCKK